MCINKQKFEDWFTTIDTIKTEISLWKYDKYNNRNWKHCGIIFNENYNLN